MAFNILDSLNNNSKNVVEDKPSANFRTKDISIFNIYRNEKNFYAIVDVEELANSILLVGLMSNLVVVYEPNDKGQEYKLISGERRLEALRSLYNKGHKEYEYVTCQVKKEQSAEEEEIEIIIANSSRVKTTEEMLQEAAKLKANLEKMRDEGKQLKGFDLNKGRLRDVVASILNMSRTKVAQIENINNNLNSNFRKELVSGNLNFATANEIAGMKKEKQEELYEEKKDSIKDLKLKDIKDIKKEEKEEKIEQKEEYQEVTAKDLLEQTKVDMKSNKFDMNKRYKFSLEKTKEYFIYNQMNFDIDTYKKFEGIEVELLSETNAKMTVNNEAMYVNPNYCIEIDEQLEGQINLEDVLNDYREEQKLIDFKISQLEVNKIIDVLKQAKVRTNLYMQNLGIYLFNIATGEKKVINEVVNDLYLLLASSDEAKQKEILNKLLDIYKETNEVVEDSILEKFEDGKCYVFSFEAYKKYCKKHGEAVGGPEAHKYDWMEDLEGKEPEEFVTEVSARIYTKDGYKYLRPCYFREMTDYEYKLKDEKIKNEKKLKRLETLRFEEGYTYKYSFAKKAEYKYLKDNVILTEKSKSNWDKENDGKEVKVINPRSAKLGDYRLNPWECIKSKEDPSIDDEEIVDLSEENSKILHDLDRCNMTNLEKIQSFDVIYMADFIWKLMLGNCRHCPVKNCKYKFNATTIKCKKSIREWLKEENSLEEDYPENATGAGEGETNE